LTIAHRGFKANHPENTMSAFIGAAASGVHAIETDLHITKDEVLVLSHVSATAIGYRSWESNELK